MVRNQWERERRDALPCRNWVWKGPELPKPCPLWVGHWEVDPFSPFLVRARRTPSPAESRRVSEREPPSYTLVNGDQMGWWSSPGRPRMRGCVFFSSSSHLVQRERLREKNSIHSASQWLTQNLFFFTLTTTYSFFPLCYSFLAHWGLSLKSHIIIESLSNIYF